MIKQGKRVHIWLPFILLFFGFSFLEFRLYCLQILDHEKLSKEAQGSQDRIIEVFPKRGIIYDRNLEKLAINVPSHSLYARPKEISHPEEIAGQLSSILEVETAGLAERLKKEATFVWLKRKLSLAQKEMIDNLDLEGIGFIEEAQRFYPQKELACHLLGFTGVDNQGLAGVELHYDKELQGEKGRFWLKRDGLGYEISFTKESLQDLVPGKGIVLTIDNVIQSIVEQEISLALQEREATSVEAVFMDPRTGEILALANKPDYDPNSYSNYSSFSRRDRIVQSLYEPGSAFKPITASALLEEGLVDQEEEIYCGESVKVANHVIHDWHSFNQNFTLAEILINSSNVGVVKLASRMEKEIFSKYLHLFGFGEKTGLDLPGEERGILRSASSWSLTDLPCIAMGQGIAVTPLQMVTALSALINGGELLRPYLVKYVRSPEGKIVEENGPVVRRRAISSFTSNQIRELLGQVVEQGTGRKAKVEGYSIGGKTGTAQIPAPDRRGYLPDKYISSFIGFAPVDSPVIAGIVVIREPTGAYYGGEIAAPLFGKIMKRVLPYLNILPQKEEWVERKVIDFTLAAMVSSGKKVEDR